MKTERNPKGAGRPHTGYYQRNQNEPILRQPFPFEGKYLVYGLASSEAPEIIQYVGFTARLLNTRYRDHVATAKKSRSPKERWVKDFLEQGEHLVLVGLEEGIETFEQACNREQHHIKELNKIYPLKNATKGGVGTPGRIVSEETRRKHSASMKGKNCRPRSKVSEGTSSRIVTSKKNRRERAREAVDAAMDVCNSPRLEFYPT